MAAHKGELRTELARRHPAIPLRPEALVLSEAASKTPSPRSISPDIARSSDTTPREGGAVGAGEHRDKAEPGGVRERRG
jgi:hypothetical protein